MNRQAIHDGLDHELHDIARLVRESATFRLVERVIDTGTRWVQGSSAVIATQGRRDRFAQMTVPTRLRIVGLLLVCAALTNVGLLFLLPRQLGPALPFAVPGLAALAGLLLMAASSALTDAWPHRFWRRRAR
jgi:hypothetical protein